MHRLVLFVFLLLFWSLLTWPGEPPAATYLQDVAVGVVVAALVVWLMPPTPNDGIAPWLQPKRYGWAFLYAFVLAAYVVKANLDVAYRVLHPAMPIHPGIVRVKTRLRGPSSRAALSNSITLTPGTLTVDVRKDGVMIVHWINVRSLDEEQAARHIIGRFEWFIEKIFE